MPVEQRHDGWWIGLVLRWALLFSLFNIYDPLRWLIPFRPGTRVASVEWFAAHLFGYQTPRGQFWDLAVDALGVIPLAVIWTIVEHRRTTNEVLRELVHLIVRFSLAAGMIQYGADKVIGHQGIPQPAPLDWLRPVGEMSAGQIMWTWLGYSPAFEFFAGINETVGGFLLFFRRTTLLGALLILPVMAYVTAMDMTFQVGPQARAALFAAAALYLVAREWRRLAGALVLGVPTTPRPQRTLWTSPRLALVGRGLWVLVVAVTMWRYVFLHVWQNADIAGRQSPLCGAYRVEQFASDGQILPAEAAYPARWRTVSINCFGDYVRIRRMDDTELLWSADPGNPFRFLFATGHGYKYGDYDRLLAKTADVQGQLRFKALPNYRSPAAVPAADPPAGQFFGLYPVRVSTGEFFTVHFSRQGPNDVSLRGRIDGIETSAELIRLDNLSFELFRTRDGLP